MTKFSSVHMRPLAAQQSYFHFTGCCRFDLTELINEFSNCWQRKEMKWLFFKSMTLSEVTSILFWQNHSMFVAKKSWFLSIKLRYFKTGHCLSGMDSWVISYCISYCIRDLESSLDSWTRSCLLSWNWWCLVIHMLTTLFPLSLSAEVKCILSKYSWAAAWQN